MKTKTVALKEEQNVKAKRKAVEYTLKANKTEFDRVQLRGAESAVKYLRHFFFDDISIYESCFMMLLNRSNTVIGYVKISQGGITGTVVDPLLVAKYAIDSLAKGVVLCHNHPSGQLRPSDGDDAITFKVKGGLDMFGITLLDHIILTEAGYYSYADEGRI
jgi:DNA repair protein RadC